MRKPKNNKPGKAKKPEAATKKAATNLDLLLDLGTEDPPSAAQVLPATTPSLGGFLSPTAAAAKSLSPSKVFKINALNLGIGNSDSSKFTTLSYPNE